MKYHVHHGRVGVYGEIDTSKWLDGNKEIAVIEGNGPTYTVSLYNDKGVAYPRRGFMFVVAQAIVQAHLIERGYTEHVEKLDTWDIRAYND